MSRDPKTREFLQGFAAALGDAAGLGHHRAVVETLADTGVTYHDLKDAGAATADLGNIAKARNAVRAQLGMTPVADQDAVEGQA